MQKALIVAYGRNGEIGAHGDLPWGRNLPGDLAKLIAPGSITKVYEAPTDHGLTRSTHNKSRRFKT